MTARYSHSLGMMDLEAQALDKGVGLGDFADRQLRAGFIRKVFGLLGVQLALTTAIGALCVFHPPVAAFLNNSPAFVMLAMLGSLGILLAFTVSEKARQSHPTNLVLLTCFTLCEGLLVGMACSRYPPSLVITAFLMTVAVCSGLSLYAMRTKTDFTAMGGMLHAMLLSFITCILLGALFHVPLVSLGVSLAGAALFSAYLVYDIQMLMGGEHTHKLSPDDYVFATIAIYLDIINIMLYILRALSDRRD